MLHYSQHSGISLDAHQWMVIENVGYMHNEIIIRCQEWNQSICRKMDGTRVQYGKWNKLNPERHVFSLILNLDISISVQHI